MGFALNQVIDNYECLGIIEEPRAGVTYKVRNLSTGEVETLRALPGTTRDQESAERLLREIRIHTRLSHPNIVVFHDAFEIAGELVMTTEFVEGRTLADLCRNGPLPPGDGIVTIMGVLEGLEEAHALGIVHRGITADHVLVAADGGVKLGGFGLAKPASDSNLTQVGIVVGDPRYISPEQVIGQVTLDGRSDIYSVGVLLYQTLSGKMPFEGRNDIEVLTAQVRSEPSPPSTVNPAISPELDRIVLTALKKNRDERFPNAKEFREALAAETAIGRKPPVVDKPDRAPALTSVSPGPRPSLRRPLILGFLILAICIASITWMVAH
jgi:serine/threonine protein kinase